VQRRRDARSRLGDGQVLDDPRADGFAIPDGAASDQR